MASLLLLLSLERFGKSRNQKKGDTMNSNITEGKWKEVKGELQKLWGDITNDDLEKTKGNVKSIIGLVQQKFGVAQEEARSKVEAALARFQPGVDEKMSDIKDDLRNSTAAQKNASADKSSNNQSII